jgi:hypothetical protein
VRSIAAALAVLATCLLLAGCTGKPGKSGTVQPNTGGRGGNTISLGGRLEILLMSDHDSIKPSQTVGISHIGSKITILPVSGEPVPAWLQITPAVRTSQYWSDAVLTFVPQQVQPHSELIMMRFTASDPDGTNAVYQDILVRAERPHYLSRRHEYVTYTQGAAAPPTSRLALIVNGPWTTYLDGSWLTANPAGGTGNALIDLTTAPQSLAEGNYVGGYNVTQTNAGRTIYYGMHLGVDPRRLETDKRGLAFSFTAGNSRTARPLRVIDTAGLQGHWRISDDAAWLTASVASGAGDATVQVTADPAGLADGQYSATLTLSPDNEPGFGNETTVRVGFHVDRATAANVSVPLAGAAPSTGPVAADPIRPFVYGFTNSGANSTLRTWNVHSGALVGSVAIANLTAARTHVSPDGSLLVVSDVTNQKLLPITLTDTTRTPGSAWTEMLAYRDHSEFAFAQLNGRTVVAWSVFQLLSPENGTRLAGVFGSPDYLLTSTTPTLAAADDGRRGCMVMRYNAVSQLLYLALGYRAGAYTGGIPDPAILAGDVTDCELDSGGRYVYAVTSTTIYRFAYQAKEPDVQRALSRGGNLQRLDNGDIYLAGEDGVWRHYDADLVQLAEHRVGSTLQFGIVSGDETRLLDFSESGVVLRNRDF